MIGHGPRRLLRGCAHVGALTATALLSLLPASRYDWVADLDPAGDPALFEDASGDRGVVILLLLACVVVVEAIAFVSARRRSERWLPLAITASAVLIWASR